MREYEYWEQASVKTMLMTERAILDYEKDLDNLYVSLLSDIEKEIRYIFNTFGKNDKLLYSNLRSRLDNNSFKKFSSKLKTISNEFEENILTTSFISEIKKLQKRSTITLLEYLQFMCKYYILKTVEQNANYVYSTLFDIYLSCYCCHFYNFIYGVQKNIEFVPVSDSVIKNCVKGKWNKATYLERIQVSQNYLIDNITDIIPRTVAMGYSIDKVVNAVNKILNTRNNYDKTIIRTSGDYINNQAHMEVLKQTSIIEEYIYVAILDAVTTVECRSLNGSVFKLSQAIVGENFPPLHFNCRSSVAPNITDTVKQHLSQLDAISRKNTIQNWLSNNLPDNQKYISNYINRYFN